MSSSVCPASAALDFLAAPDPVPLAARLVGIPSVNPRDTADPAIGGEARFAAFLADFLRSLDFAVETPAADPARPNVVGRFGHPQPERTVMIEGHLDTVAVEGMTVPPFAGEIRTGRLFGRGACDMKGPFAAALWALQPEVREAFLRSRAQLLIVGAVDEERGTTGARWLADHGVRADEAVVLEPTGLDLVLAHKNPGWLRLETTGVAGHGARPEAGINAIDGMCALLAALRNRARALAESAEHPLLGRATLNLGRIQGGHGTNIIPDHCRAEADLRLLPGQDIEDLVRDLRARADCLRVAGVVKDATLAVISTGRGFQTDPASGVAARLRRAAAAEGREARDTGSPWFSDAGAFSAVCGETLVFGPGSIDQAHTADEWIDLAELAAGGRILRRFLLDFARAHS
jgi:acetylornithine deacetylase